MGKGSGGKHIAVQNAQVHFTRVRLAALPDDHLAIHLFILSVPYPLVDVFHVSHVHYCQPIQPQLEAVRSHVGTRGGQTHVE